MPEYSDTARYQGDPLYHKQAYEFARDVIRVTNPTNSPFKWKFDGRWYVMQPGEIKDKERYWTDHYASKLAEQIIGDIITRQGEKAIQEQAKGSSDILYDKYIESVRVWNRIPRKDDRELLEKVMSGIVLGCVTKYGADELDTEDEQIVAGELRDKSFEQQLLETLSNRPLGPITQAQSTVAPVQSARVVEADEPPPSAPQPTPPPAAQQPAGNAFSLPQTVSSRSLESEVTQ